MRSLLNLKQSEIKNNFESPISDTCHLHVTAEENPGSQGEQPQLVHSPGHSPVTGHQGLGLGQLWVTLAHLYNGLISVFVAKAY